MARTSELGGVMASLSVDVILGKLATVTSKMKIVGYIINRVSSLMAVAGEFMLACQIYLLSCHSTVTEWAGIAQSV